jgi:hypothetical protein
MREPAQPSRRAALPETPAFKSNEEILMNSSTIQPAPMLDGFRSEDPLRWQRVEALKIILRQDLGQSVANRRIEAFWKEAISLPGPNSETMERLLTAKVEKARAEHGAERCGACLAPLGAKGCPACNPAAPTVPVAVGQVYESEGGRRFAVTAHKPETYESGMWCCDGEQSSSHNIPFLVERGLWSLVGCALSDGRQMCVGETWAYDENEHVLTGLFAGDSFTTAAGGHLGFSGLRGNATDSKRWCKVEPKASDYAQRCADAARVMTPLAATGSDLLALAAMHGVLTPDEARARLGLPPEPTHRCPKCRALAGFLVIAQQGAQTFSRCSVCRETIPSADLIPLAAPAAPPLSAKEQRRREIDAVLAEDKRQHPAFADARRAAVVAASDTLDLTTKDACKAESVPCLLDYLMAYESKRGGGTLPSGIGHWCTVWQPAVAAYERARSGQPSLLGRPSRSYATGPVDSDIPERFRSCDY